LYFYRTKQLPSASGLDVQVKLTEIQRAGWSSSKAGLEIRDSLDDGSARVVWDVQWSWPMVTRATYRNENGWPQYVAGDFNLSNNVSPSDPVWLRIERVTGTREFKFYYRQAGGPPPPVEADAATKAAWWGAAKGTTTVSDIGDDVYIGLFNASYKSDGASTAIFDDFGLYPDPDACPSTQTEPTLPPGFKSCTPLLKDRSFESPPASTEWFYRRPGAAYNGVTRTSDSSNAGNFALRAATHDGTWYSPYFYQKFTMSDWVISDTTSFDLNLFRNVRTEMSDPADRAADKFYAIVVDGNNPATWTALTDPTEVTNGESSAGVGVLDPDAWIERTVNLPIAAGINLEDYAEDELYLYLYNNSNTAPLACLGGCESQFYFDDVSLETCTTQSLPATISTRLTGQITLNYGGDQIETKELVKVWAYAPDGKVYETITIQNGEYNFYNLPPGTYNIFAQHYQQQGTQMATLAGDRTADLMASHTYDLPLVVDLVIYVLPDLP
jgi:hypothetical protein